MIRYENGDSDALKHIYDLYCDAFPEKERKSMDHLVGLMRNGCYRLVLMYDSTENVVELNEVVGFALLYVSNEKHFSWLDYIVIDPMKQSNGYGSKLLIYLKETFGILLFEVEVPDGIDFNRERRIQYYEKLNAVRLNWDYYLPTPEGGLKMYLYALAEVQTYHEEVIRMFMNEALRYIHSDIVNLDEILNRSIPF
ncbi:MAG: hypothetical protein BGO41_03615 [Clostridiales bacterium 38-18]|nr:MAG: hypothetical protein BGO41_03615 [Clostridiales bacterium 38-18]